MPRPRVTVTKRQREQAKRDKQQRKAERRAERKQQRASGEQSGEENLVLLEGPAVNDETP